MVVGYDWLYKFLERNFDIFVRKAGRVSLSRAWNLTREDADANFSLLKSIPENKNLMNKPAKIYNVNEAGFHLNNKSAYILGEKGRKYMTG